MTNLKYSPIEDIHQKVPTKKDYIKSILILIGLPTIIFVIHYLTMINILSLINQWSNRLFHDSRFHFVIYAMIGAFPTAFYLHKAYNYHSKGALPKAALAFSLFTILNTLPNMTYLPTLNSPIHQNIVTVVEVILFYCLFTWLCGKSQYLTTNEQCLLDSLCYDLLSLDIPNEEIKNVRLYIKDMFKTKTREEWVLDDMMIQYLKTDHQKYTYGNYLYLSYNYINYPCKRDLFTYCKKIASQPDFEEVVSKYNRES